MVGRAVWYVNPCWLFNAKLDINTKHDLALNNQQGLICHTARPAMSLALNNLRVILVVEEQHLYYLTHNWCDMWVQFLSKDISQKARLEIELEYFEVAVQHFSHYLINLETTFPISIYFLYPYWYISVKKNTFFFK